MYNTQRLYISHGGKMITIRKCILNDLIDLQEVSYKTFDDTFALLNTESNIKSYLENAFTRDKLLYELTNDYSSFYFIFWGDTLAGYMKLNEYQVQTDISDPKSMEIERIYVLNEFQGKGLGKHLLNKAIEIAKKQQKSHIWLGVWEKNNKAIQFYKSNSFYKIGTHPFFMGKEKQTDYIMRKDLE